jgi:hypothetical protein
MYFYLCRTQDLPDAYTSAVIQIIKANIYIYVTSGDQQKTLVSAGKDSMERGEEKRGEDDKRREEEKRGEKRGGEERGGEYACWKGS